MFTSFGASEGLCFVSVAIFVYTRYSFVYYLSWFIFAFPLGIIGVVECMLSVMVRLLFLLVSFDAR